MPYRHPSFSASSPAPRRLDTAAGARRASLASRLTGEFSGSRPILPALTRRSTKERRTHRSVVHEADAHLPLICGSVSGSLAVSDRRPSLPCRLCTSGPPDFDLGSGAKHTQFPGVLGCRYLGQFLSFLTCKSSNRACPRGVTHHRRPIRRRTPFALSKPGLARPAPPRNSGIWTSEAPGPRKRAPRRIRTRRLVLACTTAAAGPARLEETSKRHTLLLTGGGRHGPSLRGIGFPRRESRYSDDRPVYNGHLEGRTKLADRTNLNSNSPPTHYALFSRHWTPFSTRILHPQQTRRQMPGAVP